MKVQNLADHRALKTGIVIDNPTTPENEILFVHTHKQGKREQNEDGSWPDAITSSDQKDPEKQQLSTGVGITRYVLKDGRHTVAEVKEQPKTRCIQTDDVGVEESEATVERREALIDFMYWDDFKKKFYDCDIISHRKNLDSQYVE